MEYYLADGTGYPVCPSDGNLQVFDRDGNSKVVRWTLGSFMELNNLYASKTRLYCVEKPSGDLQSIRYLGASLHH